VERRWQPGGSNDAAAPAGLDVGEPAEPGDLVFNAEPGVKVDEVGAAAEQDVLAVIDGLAGAGVGIGGGAAANVGAAFD
jgi:hypothetical protein